MCVCARARVCACVCVCVCVCFNLKSLCQSSLVWSLAEAHVEPHVHRIIWVAERDSCLDGCLIMFLCFNAMMVGVELCSPFSLCLTSQVPLQDPCHVFSVALMTAAATAATTPPPPPPSLTSTTSASTPGVLQALTAAAFTTVCNWQHALTSTCVAQNKRLEAEAHEREERQLLLKQRKEFENKKFSQQLVWSQELSAQVELTVAAETQLTEIKEEMEKVKREAQLNQEQQEKALESFLNQHKAHMQQVEAAHARAIQDTLASYATDKHDWEQTRDKMLSEADVVAVKYAEEARQLSHTIAMLEVYHVFVCMCVCVHVCGYVCVSYIWVVVI